MDFEEAGYGLASVSGLDLQSASEDELDYLAASQALKGMDVDCENCGEEMIWGDSKCHKCGMAYNDSYWRDWFDGDYDDMSLDPYETYNQIEVIENPDRELTAEDNICCNLYWKDCKCVEAMGWEDSEYLNLSDQQREDLYLYESPCSGCKHYYQPSCRPLRAILYQVGLTGEVPGAIDVCRDFDQDERVVSIASKRR